MIKNKKYIGINISDKDFSIVAFELIGKKKKLVFVAKENLPKGMVSNGKIKDKKALGKFAQDFFQKNNFFINKNDEVAFSIPNSQVYVYDFWLDVLDENFLQSLKEEIVSNIPIDEQDLLYAYKILKQENNKKLILSVATKRSTFLSWKFFFDENNLKISLFNIEPLASFYALADKFPLQKTAFLDVSDYDFCFSVFNFDGLLFSLSAKSYESDKVEEIKNFVKNCVHYIDKNIDSSNCYRILLYGDFKQMNDLKKALGDLKINVELAKVENEKIKCAHINAYGLALRLLDEKWSKSDIFISMMGQKKKNVFLDFYQKMQNIVNNELKKTKDLKKKIILALLAIFVFGGIFAFLQYNYNKKLQEQIKNIKKIQVKIPKTIKKDVDKKVDITKKAKPVERKIQIKKMKHSLNLRSGPSVSYKILGQAKPGEEFVLLEEKENWVKIKFQENKEAWAYKDFVNFK